MATKYFLLIDGINGGSTDKDHVGWFEIDGFEFDISNAGGTVGGGGGAGKAVFSPLEVALSLDPGLAAVLADVATGKHIKAVQLEGVTKGGDTVYDLRLADVLVSRVDEGDGGSDSLSFDYSQVGLITHVQKADGSIVPGASFGFNLATNTTINPASIGTPTPAAAPASAAAAKYFLLIDGVNGGSTDKDHVGWFEIEGFTFDISNAGGTVGGGGGAGKAVFSPLEVALSLDPGLAAVLADVATGKHIKAVQLEGVTKGGDTVYDLRLADVLVSRVDEGDGGSDSLSFDYSQVGLITHVQKADGSIVPGASFGFDLAANTTINPASIGTPTPAAAPASAAAAKYFLLIDGVNGGSTDKDHVGWFEIEGFTFDISNAGGTVGGGGGAGKAVFSPLEVALSLDPGLAAVLADVATGKHIKAVQLEGVTKGGDTVYDLRLADVLVSRVDEGDGGSDSLSFDYSQVGLITHVQKADGSIVPGASFGFNLATNTTINPASIGTPTPAAAPASAAAAKYFLLIDGVNGGSTDKDHVGWFEIEGFTFDISNAGGTVGGGGGGAGKAVFSPLEVALSLDPGLAAVLADVATGKHIKAVQLEGVTANGDTVYDLRLADVLVSKVDEGNGGSDNLAFTYKQVGLITHVQQADGSIVPGASFGFNLATNTTINPASIDTPTPPDLPPAATEDGPYAAVEDTTLVVNAANGVLANDALPAGDTPPASAAAAKYFLLIDGVNGGSTDKDHVGWFEIDGFEFDISNTGGTVGGGGAGKATFSPLEVALSLDPGLAGLLADVATGKHIKAVQLEGVTKGGDTVYDLRLADVLVSRVDEGDGGSDSLSFDYSQVGLITHVQKADGSIAPGASFGFNLATNTTINPASIGTPTPAAAPASAAAAKYFLLIDGVNGGSTDKDHVGWFEIEGFTFDISNAGGTVGGGGGGAGKAVFSPLEVALSLDPGLAAVLADVATGKHIKAVQLEGVTKGGDTVYDLRLADVLVSRVDEGDGGSDSLSFDYSQVGLITHVQKADGSIAPGASFGFNLATNTTINPASIGTPTPAAAPASAAASKYFLLIDGVNGGSTDADHVGWLEIDGFEFDIGNTGSNGTGGGAGKAVFSPLEVALSLDPGLAGLLASVATGKHVKTVQLEGVTASGDTVYDLRLADVSVTKVDEGNGGSDSLAFTYKQVGLITHVQQADGSIVPGASFGFDLALNTTINPASIGTPTPAAAPASAAAAKYFLLIDGINGGSTDADHVGWFEIDGFEFDIGNTGSNGTGGGGGAGKAIFSPLEVALSLDPGLAAVLADAATGKHVKTVQLEGVTANGDTVYDLRLADVLVSKVNEGNGGSDSLAFEYRQVGLITHVQQANGSIVPGASFGFDLATNTTINPASIGTPTPAAAPASAAAAKYFLLIDGVNGGSTDKDHVGWFEIEGFTFDISNAGGTVGGGGGGAGKATFSPLEVALSLDPGLAGVLADVATGKHIKAVQLEGVTKGGDTVYDLRLADVLVSRVDEGDGGSDSLSFDYSQVGLITHVQKADGSIAPGASFGFNLATNTTINPASIGTPTPAAAPASAAAAKYFLLIDGVNGGSTDKDHVGWFEIEGFTFDISNAGGTVGGGGGGAGKAVFSPLEVALSLDPGLAAVLADVATGKHIKAVQLEGVTKGGDTVYDLRLADVLVSKVDEGNGGSDNLAFTYKQVGLITHLQQADGSIVPGTSFGFDLALGTTIDPTSIGTPDQPKHLVAELVYTTAHGQLTLNPDGSFNYTPDADFNGSDSFVYRANDGSTDSNEVTVVINVTAVNDAPVAAAGSAVGIEDKPILGQAVATDIDSPALSYALVGANGGAQHGTVTMNANGQFSYVPTANYHGPDSFAFKASDGALESNLATVSLTVNPVNDAPKASPDIAGVYFKEGWHFGHNDAKHPSVIQKDAAHGVLANDTDVDLDALHVSTVSFGTTSKTVAPGGSALLQGKYGTLMMKSDGSYAYVAGKEGNAPSQGLAQDRFVYSVDDGHGGKAQSTLTISILDDDMTYLAGKPNTPLVASKGEQVLDGASGNQILAGGKGNDVLIGGPNDILFGDKGHDSFVFNPGFGKNTVVDFRPEDHVLQFSRADFASVKDIFTHMSSDGQGNTLITHDPNNVVTLLNVAPGSLHFHDFLVV